MRCKSVRWSSVFSIGLLLVGGSGGLHAADAQSAATVQMYEDPNGGSCFALMLRPDALPQAKSPRDHVVLVDTSASQVGAHRRQAFAVLRSFLEALPAEDRVCLFAVDVKTDRLTDSFVAPGDEQVEAALAALNRRVPLGATNLQAAIARAMEALAEAREATGGTNLRAALADALGDQPAGSILYIGDGMSTARLIQTEDLAAQTAQLRERRIPVHSYAVGPRKDLHLLGIFAQQTGGIVLFDAGDDQRDAADAVGQRLVVAVNGSVFYPASVALEPNVEALLPSTALPLRMDRATTWLGRGDFAEDAVVTVRGVSNGKEVVWTWTPGTIVKQPENSFLKPLSERAAADNGLSVSLAGEELLQLARQEFAGNVAALLDAGEQALAARQTERAEQIGVRLAKLDPANPELKTLQNAAGKARVQTVSQVQPLPEVAPPAEEPLPPAEGLLNQVPQLEDEAPGLQRDLILEEMQRIRINTERMQLEVANTIQAARAQAERDPAAALELLKIVQTTLRAARDIDPEVQEQLAQRLGQTYLDIAGRAQYIENQRFRLQESRAQQEQQARVIEQLALEEERLHQLLERVRALIDTGRHGDDAAFEEAAAVADMAVNLKPGDGPATAARFTAEATLYLNRAFRLRQRNADLFLETLHQVELSHVPFPDEPPIRFPPAPVWQALSERRKKWASVDLKKFSPNEERIVAALSEQTNMEFVDTPLTDAIEFLKDLHGIEIWIDQPAITDEGIATDEPINLSLSGITLRSALRLMLEPLGLTYVIEDEVMKITTQLKADDALSTRVYPVADLVIPIITPMVGGIGQGMGGAGGGMGGGGMGGGGMGGGGMGGGGMGGGGMGGMGGGGGFFSVPAPKLPKPAAGPAPQAKPQPVADPEARQLLENILQSSTGDRSFTGQAFAQVNDKLPKRAEFNNDTLRSVKKKPVPTR